MYDFSIIRALRHRSGLRIQQVSERSAVSAAVISKLERNVSYPGLETLDRISRVFNMNPSDLLSLAESRTAHQKHESSHRADGFVFREIECGAARILLGEAPQGARLSRPEVHADDHEICWVLEGHLLFSLPQEEHALHAGDAIQFDAVLEHVYEAIQPVRFLLAHIPKHV